MAVTAFLVGTAALLLTTSFPWHVCVIKAMIAAPVAAYVELISHNGNDTVSVPVAITVVLCALGM